MTIMKIEERETIEIYPKIVPNILLPSLSSSTKGDVTNTATDVIATIETTIDTIAKSNTLRPFIIHISPLSNSRPTRNIY